MNARYFPFLRTGITEIHDVGMLSMSSNRISIALISVSWLLIVTGFCRICYISWSTHHRIIEREKELNTAMHSIAYSPKEFEGANTISSHTALNVYFRETKRIYADMKSVRNYLQKENMDGQTQSFLAALLMMIGSILLQIGANTGNMPTKTRLSPVPEEQSQPDL